MSFIHTCTSFLQIPVTFSLFPFYNELHYVDDCKDLSYAEKSEMAAAGWKQINT